MTETMTKERGVVLTAKEVRALRDGRLGQLRFVVKPRPPEWTARVEQHPDGHWLAWGEPGSPAWAFTSPYRPGDVLYVRESWRCGRGWDKAMPKQIDPLVVRYEADGAVSHGGSEPLSSTWGRLRSPLYLPPSASRFLLRIESVRVQRVQEITEEDARACGMVPGVEFAGTLNGQPAKGAIFDPRYAFTLHWEHRHPGSWSRNDWVWVVNVTKEANHAG